MIFFLFDRLRISFIRKYLIESQDCRVAWVGRDLQHHLISMPLPFAVLGHEITNKMVNTLSY